MLIRFTIAYTVPKLLGVGIVNTEVPCGINNTNFEVQPDTEKSHLYSPDFKGNTGGKAYTSLLIDYHYCTGVVNPLDVMVDDLDAIYKYFVVGPEHSGTEAANFQLNLNMKTLLEGWNIPYSRACYVSIQMESVPVEIIRDPNTNAITEITPKS